MSVPFNVSESSNNLGAAQVMAGMVSAIGAFKENIIPQHYCDDKNNDED